MKVDLAVLGSPSLIVLTVSCGCKATLNLNQIYIRAQELCESRGGRPGLPVPGSQYGVSKRKAILNLLLLKCCFASTETVGLLGTGALDGHLDFHTAPEL